jgi:hypothetical protein
MNLADLVPMLAVTALVAMPASAAAQAPRQDGQWEIKAQMEMGGLPVQLEPVTTTQCVSKEDAKNPQNLLPTGESANGCRVSDYRVEGNTTTFSLTCDGPPKFSGVGEIVYGEDKYTGSMKMDVGGQAMTVTYSAKRTGDCIK